jgi:branched-chain amino acid transport system ATP-binding protein
MSTETSGLSVRRLCAWYGQAQALFDIDLTVPAGSVTGLLGRNGAGKSTLLRSIAGAHRRRTGETAFAGRDLSAAETHVAAVSGLTLVREGARVFANLTAAEHLALGSALAGRRGQTAPSTDELLTLFPMFRDRLNHKAGYLSGGQRQGLALAMAFAGRPRCLLLDEPSAGLARVVAEGVFASIARLASSGMTLLIAEQEPLWLDGLVDRLAWLDNGHLVDAPRPPER